ncbi:OmpA family protein, partial [Butyricimonas virosa]
MRVRAQEHQHKTDSTNNIVLYFKIDGAILDSTYMGNNESLKKLDELIKNELIIPNLDSITIVASSSPDGKEAYNLELSRKRAESVKAYITGKYPEIKKELVYARYTGENWVDFKRMIETDKNIPHRERLINIINSDRENGAKEWLIKTLANGESWRYIRKNFLPQLR